MINAHFISVLTFLHAPPPLAKFHCHKSNDF